LVKVRKCKIKVGRTKVFEYIIIELNTYFAISYFIIRYLYLGSIFKFIRFFFYCPIRRILECNLIFFAKIVCVLQCGGYINIGYAESKGQKEGHKNKFSI